MAVLQFAIDLRGLRLKDFWFLTDYLIPMFAAHWYSLVAYWQVSLRFLLRQWFPEACKMLVDSQYHGVAVKLHHPLRHTLLRFFPVMHRRVPLVLLQRHGQPMQLFPQAVRPLHL